MRIAAPDHRQHFQLAQRVRLLDLVALLLERDLEQLGLGRRLAIVGGDSAPVFVERVEVVPQGFGKPSAQHRDRRLLFRRHADHVELGAALGGAGIILDLERGAHGIHRHDALQVERQRGDREFDILELLARVGPFRPAAPAPEPATSANCSCCRSRDWRDPSAPAGPADQDARDRMHHQRDRIRPFWRWDRPWPLRSRPWLPGTWRAPCRSGRDRAAPADAGPARRAPSPGSARPRAR